jgi:hypothetical protein
MTGSTAPRSTTVESVSNVGESASLAVVQALARILEYAAVLRVHGHEPNAAIARALKAHRTGFALACVARAAWTLVVRFDGAGGRSPTAPGDGAT